MSVKKRNILLLALLLLVPDVSALTAKMDPFELLAEGFALLRRALQSPDIVYGITIILSFMLFFVVFGAPLKRIRIFQGEGGLGLNTFGKMFTSSVAGLSCLAVFAFREHAVDAARSVFGPFGFLGALFLGGVIFVMVYRGMRDTLLLGFGNFFWGLVAGVAAMWLIGALLGGGNQENIWAGLILIVSAVIIVTILYHGIRWAWHRHFPLTMQRYENVERTEQRDQRRVNQDQQQTQQQDEYTRRLERQVVDLSSELTEMRRLIRETIEASRGTGG